MIELCAITRSGLGGRGLSPEPATNAKYRKECTRADAHLAVVGDRPVDSLFFDSPEVTLICRADLLTQYSSAAELARLYLQQGDDFVTRLRGTFAIVLYDYKSKALKAWTDHFGTERLLFAESSKGFAVST